jgi:RimJ/RimL family protein N-acetyltransferase
MGSSDRSPLSGLRLRTPRLELRLPTEDELIQLAGVAQRGVHPRDEMPFLVPWTDRLGSPSFPQEFVDDHLQLIAGWKSDQWCLELGVFVEERPIGIQAIRGDDFRTERTVHSSSWLGQRFQRKGYGTEMREAILELAFVGLGAVAARSGVVDGTVASARISAKLGYVDSGEAWHVRRGERVHVRHFLLSRERWEQGERPPVAISGLRACLPLFGVPGHGTA